MMDAIAKMHLGEGGRRGGEGLDGSLLEKRQLLCDAQEEALRQAREV